MGSIPEAQVELQTLAQWVCWYLKQEGERTTKPPINPNSHPGQPLEERLASPSNPTTWGSYQQARHMSRYYAGIGFMFSDNDLYCGVDLDKCRNPRTGQITEWARKIITDLNSYSEISPSGTGVHIILRASMKETIQALGRKSQQHKRGHIEIYDAKRYFTFSWNHLAGTPTTIEERQGELNRLYLFVFPDAEPQTPTTIPPASSFSLSDEWIIERASMARNGRGPLFQRLMRGDASDYMFNGQIDHSRADQALLGILAYWTGRDARRMEAIFTRSGLYRPDRWNDPAGDLTYGQRSIQKAIGQCYAIYNPQWAEAHRYSTANTKKKRETDVSKHEEEGKGK